MTESMSISLRAAADSSGADTQFTATLISRPASICCARFGQGSEVTIGHTTVHAFDSQPGLSHEWQQ